MHARNTIKWFLLIVLVLGLAGGGYAYWVWTNANRLLLQNVRAKIAEMAPGWDVKVGAARFDWHRRVHLYDITLKSPDGQSEIIRIPEAVLVVDREKLADSQIVDVQRIRLIRPELLLVRDSGGRWNWRKLPPLKQSAEKPPLPEFVVEEATVTVRLEQAGGAKPAEFTLREADLQCVPAAQREFLVKAETVVRQAGKLELNGRWNLDTGAWVGNGRMHDVRANGEILSLAVGASPELRANVARIEAKLRELTPADEWPKTPINADAVPDFGASATVDLNFHWNRKANAAEPEFDIHARFRRGRIENPVLPFTLNNVAGDVHWTNERLEFKKITASSGETRIAVEAVARRHNGNGQLPNEIKVAAFNVPLDRRLRKRLSPDLQEIYDTIQPDGRIDASAVIRPDAAGVWKPGDLVLTAKNCSFSHVEFPYRFSSVTGTVQQLNDRTVVRLEGKAGDQPASLNGVIVETGDRPHSHYDLRIRGMRIDQKLRTAVKPAVRKAIDNLSLTGQADVRVLATFDERHKKSPRLQLFAALKEGAVDYSEFPYRLHRLTGDVHYDSLTDVWTFTRLKAFNGSGEFNGSATLTEMDGKQRLAMTVTGKGAFFDRPLYRALPKGLQGLWRELSPTGRIDLTVDIDWNEGSDAVITIPTCTISQGTMTAKSFPFEFKNVSAKFAYASDRLRVLSFNSKQEQSTVRAGGFVDIFDDGEWRLNLSSFRADNLTPDKQFRKTLSPKLRAVFNEIDPSGPISCVGRLEFRGTNNDDDAVTAYWKLNVTLDRNGLVLGTKLTNVSGDIAVEGTWDGAIVDMRKGTNRFDLRTATVHGYTFTQIRGPFRFHKTRLEVGAPETFRPRRRGEPPPRVDPKDRITAKAVGGTFTLDAVALFDKQAKYRLLVTMDRARLERFAREYLSGAQNLRGVMYGRIDLAGQGTSSKNLVGSGRLLISPAALYELPVLAQVFSVISFTPPDKTAFRFAFADFQVQKQQFLFDRIDLVGDSINLRGRGVADFDGRLAIDFYSMLPRSRLPTDLLKNIVGTATAGWIGVNVTGTAKRPRARVRAVPQVEDALKAFLNGLGQPPTGPRTLPASSRRETPPRGYRR